METPEPRSRTGSEGACRLSPACDPGFSAPFPPGIRLRDGGDLASGGPPGSSFRRA